MSILRTLLELPAAALEGPHFEGARQNRESAAAEDEGGS
jgi:hypothetical protein